MKKEGLFVSTIRTLDWSEGTVEEIPQSLHSRLQQLGLPHVPAPLPTFSTDLHKVAQALERARIGHYLVGDHAVGPLGRRQQNGTSCAAALVDQIGQTYNVEWVFNLQGDLVAFAAALVG